MNKLLRPFRKHEPDIDVLSELVDGRLAPTRAAEIERHISTCASCRETHAGLLETRATLAAMPDVSHPRSFRLRQAEVEAPARAPAAGRSTPMRWAPACAAVSAIVFVVVLGADLTSRESNNSVQFSSLESNERTGMTAADDAANGESAPAAGAIAPGATTGTLTEGGEDGSANPPVPGASTQADAASEPTDSVAPTGAPPNGDVPVAGASGAQTDAAATVGNSAEGTDFVTPTDTSEALGAVPPEAAVPSTSTDADSEKSSAYGSDGGNRNAFLVVEIAAAAIALLAGAAYVARRWTQRGNAS